MIGATSNAVGANVGGATNADMPLAPGRNRQIHPNSCEEAMSWHQATRTARAGGCPPLDDYKGPSCSIRAKQVAITGNAHARNAQKTCWISCWAFNMIALPVLWSEIKAAFSPHVKGTFTLQFMVQLTALESSPFLSQHPVAASSVRAQSVEGYARR
jgi:hypothetical protein